MTSQSAVQLALLVSLWLVVLSLGARSRPEDMLYLVKRPWQLLRAVLAIFVIAPAIAVAISSAFDLAPATKFALIAMAVAPVPPILAFKQAKVGAKGDYSIGLLAAVAVISLVATPLLVALVSRIMGVEAAVELGDVATTIVMTIAIPLGAGMVLASIAPRFAASIQHFAFILGLVVLLGALGLVIASAWPEIAALLGNGSILAIAAMVVLGLAVGHLLGSSIENDSGALALATTTRHPGVALSIATASFPARQPEAMAGVLLFLLVSGVITGLYVRWMKARATASPIRGTGR